MSLPGKRYEFELKNENEFWKEFLLKFLLNTLLSNENAVSSTLFSVIDDRCALNSRSAYPVYRWCGALDVKWDDSALYFSHLQDVGVFLKLATVYAVGGSSYVAVLSHLWMTAVSGGHRQILKYDAIQEFHRLLFYSIIVLAFSWQIPHPNPLTLQRRQGVIVYLFC